MDLECRQETVVCWDAVSRLKVEREESGEMIVPDACPDVGTVLAARPRLLLQRKEAMTGRGELSGLIRVGVLYRPEGEGDPAAMEVTLPFSATAEHPALTAECLLWAEPRILSADVHLLNSRKVLVKVIYCLEITVYRARTETLLSLVEDPELWGVRQQTGMMRGFFSVSVQEKTFTYQDTLTLPTGQPDPAEVLLTEARCLCTEARVVGDKLLFKGEAAVDLLCRDGEGGLFPVRFSLPFSQVMEGESDGDVCRTSVLITDMTCLQDPEDCRTFRMELSMTAQGEVCRTVETPVLSDLYSMGYEVETEGEDLPVCDLKERDEARETARILLPWPAGEAGGSCQDLHVRLGRSRVRREEGKLLLAQEVCVSALCESEAGPVGLEGTGEIVHALPAEEGELCLWTAEPCQEPAARADAQGLEAAVTLNFRWLRLEEGTCPVIRRVSLGEKLQRTEDSPSLVIRAVREGQTLWDIAKANSAAQEDIMAASGLTGEEIFPGQMLLIPRTAG